MTRNIITSNRRIPYATSAGYSFSFSPFLSSLFRLHTEGEGIRKRKGEASKTVISEGKFVRRNEIIQRRSCIILAVVRARHNASSCYVPLIRGIRIERSYRNFRSRIDEIPWPNCLGFDFTIFLQRTN